MCKWRPRVGREDGWHRRHGGMHSRVRNLVRRLGRAVLDSFASTLAPLFALRRPLAPRASFLPLLILSLAARCFWFVLLQPLHLALASEPAPARSACFHARNIGTPSTAMCVSARFEVAGQRQPPQDVIPRAVGDCARHRRRDEHRRSRCARCGLCHPCLRRRERHLG